MSTFHTSYLRKKIQSNYWKICFRSTPMPDDFFGGKDDLTSALGYEENGVTTILFRKKIDGN